jgi:flagellar hook-associated protein 2
LDSVIQGVSIDLKSVSTDPVTLTVTRDTTAIQTGVDTFVQTFNTLIDDITKQTSYDQDSNTKGTLLGDSTTETLRQALYNTIEGNAKGVSSQFHNLSDVGLSIGDGGHISIDETKLQNAIGQDPQGVSDLFTARVIQPPGTQNVNGDPNITTTDPNAPTQFSSLGVLSQIEELSNSYLDSVNGKLTQQTQTVKNQIDLQNQRITDLQAQLDNKRAVLQQQFLAMEEAIGQLQSQGSALGSIGQTQG